MIRKLLGGGGREGLMIRKLLGGGGREGLMIRRVVREKSDGGRRRGDD